QASLGMMQEPIFDSGHEISAILGAVADRNGRWWVAKWLSDEWPRRGVLSRLEGEASRVVDHAADEKNRLGLKFAASIRDLTVWEQHLPWAHSSMT
ncbi:MAG: hypothetical protein R6U98_10345, partial [Pirellulaceae bacterium]